LASTSVTTGNTTVLETSTPPQPPPQDPKSQLEGATQPVPEPPHQQGDKGTGGKPPDDEPPKDEVESDDEMASQPKFPGPENFKGERAFARGWLQECESYFRTPETKMTDATDRSKIVFCLTKITDNAREWKHEQLRKYELPNPNDAEQRSFPTWAQFKDQFLMRFSPEEDADKALNQLMTLISKKHTDVIAYLGQFDTLTSRAGVNQPQQKLQYFMKGLPRKFSDGLILWGVNTYDQAVTKVRDMKKGLDRRGAIEGNSRDSDAMDTSIDRTQINAVKAQSTDKCYYCEKTGHWAKDCYQKKRDQGQGTSTNGVSFQRGNYNRGRGRGNGRGNSRGRGNTRGSQRGRGRGKSIRAITHGEEEQTEDFEGKDDLILNISAVLAGVDDEKRDQIIQQLSKGFQ
jgi:hypothetical protein